MQKSETRRFLEEQFAQYEKARQAKASAELKSEIEKETEPADEYLQAPSVYDAEVAEIFKTLPLSMRRYLHRREKEFENYCSRCEEELQLERFLNEEFKTKGCCHGFKTPKDWIEKLIFAEEMLEASPKAMLCYLARAYGVDFGGNERANPLTDVLYRIEALQSSLAQLQSRFEQREKDFAAAAAAAEAAKKAKAAGFSPKGKALAAEDFKNMTTRQILERKFAELED